MPPAAGTPASEPPVTYEEGSDLVRAELADERKDEREELPRPRRRVVLPLVLFLLTCLSTLFAGATRWNPPQYLFSPQAMGIDGDAYLLMPMRLTVLEHWRSGLIYMACVLAILLTHEMGHFLMTVVYRVRASYPYFIPFPVSPIGTMGAVIGMDGLKANRRQIFDIGLAGPLAGLAVAVPIIWIGLARLDLSSAEPSGQSLDLPLAMRLAVSAIHPGQYDADVGVPMRLVNPYLMAGWVGLLITGINMMPVSQLDGGHVLYALFGRKAHWLARTFMLLAFAYAVIDFAVLGGFPWWILMAVLVLLIGTDHPPTSDDNVKLGWGRTLLGAASLLIPVLCFVPHLRL